MRADSDEWSEYIYIYIDECLNWICCLNRMDVSVILQQWEAESACWFRQEFQTPLIIRLSPSYDSDVVPSPSFPPPPLLCVMVTEDSSRSQRVSSGSFSSEYQEGGMRRHGGNSIQNAWSLMMLLWYPPLPLIPICTSVHIALIDIELFFFLRDFNGNLELEGGEKRMKEVEKCKKKEW